MSDECPAAVPHLKFSLEHICHKWENQSPSPPFIPTPVRAYTPPPCDIPSGCCFFTGPWTVTRSSLCTLRRGSSFCRLLQLVLLLVSFPRSPSPVVGMPGLCWL